MTTTPTTSRLWAERWQRFATVVMRAFHRYANWLVGITWKRFVVLSILLMIVAAILPKLPPFSWSVTETIEQTPATPRPPKPPKPPKATPAPKEPVVKVEKPRKDGAGRGEGIDISIDERGIRITPRSRSAAAASAASAASAAGAASGAASSAAAADTVEEGSIRIALPPGVNRDDVREALREAKEAIEEAVRDQRQAAEDAAQAARDAQQAIRDAELAAREAAQEAGVVIEGPTGKIRRTHKVHWGDFLTDLALLWIMFSAIVKATYKGRIQAEVKAAQATETAEAESLRRQVVEARMAAMQAQVEPHFLFNTLASIDHLIETDPPRASQMQKNLIALLRASMPTMREATSNGTAGGVRDLSRELAVIRPYLEILKVRMEERLTTSIDVPDGLLSAEFPPMMIQTLVENAIKHGLEPKAEGGHLAVKAEIVHGKLQVSVADTGLGFGRAATAGTGVGLANIRERLQLLYGPKANLTVAENPGGGTLVTITVPYRSLEGDA